MLKPLTSFRFIAAFFVFVHHLHYFKEVDYLKPIYDTFFENGYIGVTFFFVLSGFILTYSYSDKFNAPFSAGKVFDFYKARIARIYPLHILTLLLVIPLMIVTIKQSPFFYFALGVLNASLLQGFFSEQHIFLSYNYPSWSLSAEMLFYLSFPFIFIFLSKRLTGVIKIISALAIFISLGMLLAWIFKDVSQAKWLFYYFPITRLWDFIAGILLGLLWKHSTVIASSYRKWTVYEIGSLVFFGATIYISQFVHETLTWGMLYIPSISLIVWIFSFQKGYISKVMSNRYLVFAGEISFSFYMIHQVILRYMELTGLLHIYPVLNAVIAFSITVMLSALTYKYFEIPVMKKIKVFKVEKRFFGNKIPKFLMK